MDDEIVKEEDRVSFDDILDGALGPGEAAAARKWIENGAIIAPPPSLGWVFSDTPPGCYDTRVWDSSSDVEEAVTTASEAETDDEEPEVLPAPKIRSLLPILDVPRQPRSTMTRGGPLENQYARNAFVGHSDTIGTLARRKARSSGHNGGAKNEDAEEVDDEVTPPLLGGNAAAAAAGGAAAAAGASASGTALPSGWTSYELTLKGPRNSTIYAGKLFVSQTGIASPSLKAARTLSRTELSKMSVQDVRKAAEWIRDLGKKGTSAMPRIVDATVARQFVVLERRKTALRCRALKGPPPKERLEREDVVVGVVSPQRKKAKKKVAEATGVEGRKKQRKSSTPARVIVP